MPGGRSRSFRFGDTAERLAEFILGSMAFTTLVSRQDDVGYDLFCVLFERDKNLLRAGPFFTVQVKGRNDSIIYESDHAKSWITNQHNPFFICIADRKSCSVELYSTWDLLNQLLDRGHGRIVLVPSEPPNGLACREFREEIPEQVVYLGKPVLRISVQEAMDEDQATKYGEILHKWVALDRENIVNRWAGFYWVVGPRDYETNKQPYELGDVLVSFYRNPKNRAICERNFARSATALRLILQDFDPAQEKGLLERIAALEHALVENRSLLDPLSINMLRKQLELDI